MLELTSYNALVKDRIFFGGVADVQDAVKNEQVDLIVDVRVKGVSEEEQLASATTYIHRPIADEDQAEVIAKSIQIGAQEIIAAYNDGKKVFFHCGSGGGRAGVMAVATLMELGTAQSLEEAEQKVKDARSIVNIRPNMKDALEQLYK